MGEAREERGRNEVKTVKTVRTRHIHSFWASLFMSHASVDHIQEPCIVLGARDHMKSSTISSIIRSPVQMAAGNQINVWFDFRVIILREKCTWLINKYKY